jgi:hypothetical protein
MTRTMLIVFSRKNKTYRMRVAKLHEHPGDRDRVEISSKDMLGDVSWSTIPDGHSEVPCSEWLIRRALWHAIGDPSLREVDNGLVTIYLGEI